MYTRHTVYGLRAYAAIVGPSPFFRGGDGRLLNHRSFTFAERTCYMLPCIVDNVLCLSALVPPFYWNPEVVLAVCADESYLFFTHPYSPFMAFSASSGDSWKVFAALTSPLPSSLPESSSCVRSPLRVAPRTSPRASLLRASCHCCLPPRP